MQQLRWAMRSCKASRNDESPADHFVSSDGTFCTLGRVSDHRVLTAEALMFRPIEKREPFRIGTVPLLFWVQPFSYSYDVQNGPPDRHGRCGNIIAKHIRFQMHRLSGPNPVS